MEDFSVSIVHSKGKHI